MMGGGQLNIGAITPTAGVNINPLSLIHLRHPLLPPHTAFLTFRPLNSVQEKLVHRAPPSKNIFAPFRFRASLVDGNAVLQDAGASDLVVSGGYALVSIFENLTQRKLIQQLHRFETTIKPTSAASTTEKLLSLPVKEIKERCKTWLWRGYRINYLTYPEPPGDDDPTSLPRNPLLLVHGFGASIAHWRKNIDTLSQNNTVYAIDLLGFGASDKPKGFVYSTEIWGQLILDFLDEIIRIPTVLIGNSVGSLACLVAAAGTRQSLIRGLVLLNCAGGMNNKAVVDDWRIKLLLPLFWLIDYLFKQRAIASFIFDRVKNKESIRSILMSVYGNQESVDKELIELIWEPANDEGALDAFVSIVTGEPGPTPLQLIPKIQVPVLVLWGDQDPFTPLDGPVGKYFSSLPDQLSNFKLFVLDGVGHCPHDDRPELVHSRLLPWLKYVSTANDVID